MVSTKQEYIFNKNVKALEKHRPQLMPFVKVPDKPITLKVNFDKKMSKMILEQEYDKHKVLIDHCINGLVFCIEPHILKGLFAKYPWYQNFFMLFPSVEYFNQMLYNFDLTGIIKLEAFKPILGANDLQLEHNFLYNCEKVDVMHNGIRVFAYQPFDQVNVNLLKAATEQLKKVGTALHINLNTSIIYGERIFRNDMRSIDKQLKHHSIEVLRDTAKDKPILAVACGPSLTKQLPFIKSIQHEVFIVAVAAAMKPLRAAGIEADIYTVIDMDDIIEKYFIDVDLKDTKIVIEMATYWGVAENHPEANFIFSQASAAAKTYINEMLEKFNVRIPAESRVHGAMTVAMLSIQIANLMGASQVIMVGQDLAYGEATSHLPGSDHSSSVQMIINKDTNQEYLLFENYGEKKNAAVPMQRVKAWNEKDTVPTTMQFVAYIEFMTRFFKTTGLKPINCTEGGAHIPNLEHITLQEAYDKYIKDHKVLTKELSVVRHREIAPDKLTEGIAYIEETLAVFKQILKIAEDGIAEFKNKPPDFDKINVYIKKIMQDNLKYSNFISQNNYSGYYLYKYLKLANTHNEPLKAAIDRRNMARLLFDTVKTGSQSFIDEYTRILERVKKL